MSKHPIAKRFRGFLPVVVDVETGGFEASTDALLEIAAIILDFNEHGELAPVEEIHCHVEPFPNAVIREEALKVNHIQPDHPFRFAKPEAEALDYLFAPIRNYVQRTGCERAVLVGHNAWFDLSFLNAAILRCKLNNSPFHRFTSFDTATLAGIAYGETVLARAVRAAKIRFDTNEAHSAVYDTQKTAELFCRIVNHFPMLT